MAANPDDPRIRESAWVVLLLWSVSIACIQFHRLNPTKFAVSRTGVRIAFSLGLAAMLLHVAIAFHLGHEWSHANAFDRTERIGGYGEGLFVNHFFVVVWFVEVMWMWVAFESYMRRRAWLNGLVVGFMWFVLFNAAVVYGDGVARWGGLLFLTAPWILLALETKGRLSSTERRWPENPVPPPAEEPGRTP